jgi:hypothetical protein
MNYRVASCFRCAPSNGEVFCVAIRDQFWKGSFRVTLRASSRRCVSHSIRNSCRCVVEYNHSQQPLVIGNNNRIQTCRTIAIPLEGTKSLMSATLICPN